MKAAPARLDRRTHPAHLHRTALVSQFKAAGLLLNMVTGIDYKAAVVLFGVIVFVYVAFGGYFAVVYTDAVQGGLMLFGIAALVITALIAVGGNLGEAYAARQSHWCRQLAHHRQRAYIHSLYRCTDEQLLWCTGRPQLYQGLLLPERPERAETRLYHDYEYRLCYRSLHHRHRPVRQGSVPRSGSPDQTVFMMIDSLLPPVLGGLVLAALAAAMMSTMDGLLLMCASTVENDILVRTFNKNLSEKQRMTVARITVLVIGAISIIWGLNPPEMLALLMYPAWGILGLSFALCFYGGLYWKRLNAPGRLRRYGGWCRHVPHRFRYRLVSSWSCSHPDRPDLADYRHPYCDLQHQAHLGRNTRKVLPGQGKSQVIFSPFHMVFDPLNIGAKSPHTWGFCAIDKSPGKSENKGSFPSREGSVMPIGWWIAIAIQAAVFIAMLLARRRI